MYNEKRRIDNDNVEIINILDTKTFHLDVKQQNETDLVYSFIDKNDRNKSLEFVINQSGRISNLTNKSFDISHILHYSINIEDESGEEDYGLSDPLLFAILVSRIDTKKLIIPHKNILTEEDYFDANNPTKEDFLGFLELGVNVQEKLIIVPITVKDHFSTLFIDSKKHELYLFDSGLSYTMYDSIEDEEQRTEVEKVLISGSLEDIGELSEKEILLTGLKYTTNPNAREFVFGKNLAKDIICLNNYCLQDDYSCGYWTIAACEIGSSYEDTEQIKTDCEDGIFQIKLAKRVLEITDDIRKGVEQKIILINPGEQPSNVSEYSTYKKTGEKTVFIKNIEAEDVIGVKCDINS